MSSNQNLDPIRLRIVRVSLVDNDSPDETSAEIKLREQPIGKAESLGEAYELIARDIRELVAEELLQSLTLADQCNSTRCSHPGTATLNDALANHAEGSGHGIAYHAFTEYYQGGIIAVAKAASISGSDIATQYSVDREEEPRLSIPVLRLREMDPSCNESIT